ncbi:ADP-ribosylglycohydrolase family protein [Pseudohongiella acticola]|jgi:ADP-ribosylglycohydrolase|uniref:ADP-ribosylglycohydrolase family protein n=1 Tax=Pseudohongiella acticola TaxID=1524254 RepID=UPI0030EE5918
MTEPQNRAQAALKALFVGDALAMPVHWFYRPADIYQQFPGGVRDLNDAPAFHPSSIMSLHSTNSGGRRSRQNQAATERSVVGDVILKGKRQFWNIPNQHYHQGMRAGENTLNAHCARAVMRSIAANADRYDAARFVDHYIDLLTADPPAHPDTYAESYHRGFFANLDAGKPPLRCGAVTHDTPSIGGLVTIAPIVFAERLRGVALEEVQELCHQHLLLTHPDTGLARTCRAYVNLLDTLLFREESDDVMSILAQTAQRSIGLDLPSLLAKTRDDQEVLGRKYSIACYIDGAWPGILYLAARYCGDSGKALIANTNLGGDNVHRGAVLGVISALCQPSTDVENWYQRLIDEPSLSHEINRLLTV